MATYNTFDIQLYDALTRKAITSTGGTLYVTEGDGLRGKADLVNPDSDYASLANPVTATRGKFRFAIANTGLGEPAVDVFGMAPGGQAFQALNIRAGNPTDIFIDTSNVFQQLVVPFAIADTTHSTETDTGFDFPTGATLLPYPAVDVRVADTGETIDVGLKSGEIGGDADGIMVAVSVAATGLILPHAAATATLGVLLLESVVADAGTAAVRDTYVVGSTAVSLTYTLSADTDTAVGYIKVPYILR